MIDGAAYFRACARPFDPLTDNCLHAAHAAAPNCRDLSRAVELWGCMADFQQRHAYDHVTEFLPQALTYLGRPIGGTLAPTGHEVGIAIDHGRPVVVVGLQGGWYGRTVRGVVRVRSRAVLMAWGVCG
jgi:hypothetical protein